MAQIVLQAVSKQYQVYKRPPGLIGAIRGAFCREHQLVDALNNVSFSINAGELVGYIGPNGAGKSTTVKIMSGILLTAATAELWGECPGRSAQPMSPKLA